MQRLTKLREEQPNPTSRNHPKVLGDGPESFLPFLTNPPEPLKREGVRDPSNIARCGEGPETTFHLRRNNLDPREQDPRGGYSRGIEAGNPSPLNSLGVSVKSMQKKPKSQDLSEARYTNRDVTC